MLPYLLIYLSTYLLIYLSTYLPIYYFPILRNAFKQRATASNGG